MLRIDVNGRPATHRYRIPAGNPYVGRTGRDEIWQRGLRNPWRFSFDRATGDLWIGDVGQDRYEEVDRRPRPRRPRAGVNCGWRAMEGRHCYIPSTGCNTTGKTLPMLDYSHGQRPLRDHAAATCTAARAIPALQGWYVFGDYCSGQIWASCATAGAHASKVRAAQHDRSDQLVRRGRGRRAVRGRRGGTIYRFASS